MTLRLVAEALGCQRGGREVLSELSMSVTDGEALSVVGPNGAGKSTLLRLIAGLLRPSSGSLRLEGGDPEAGIGEHCHYFGHQDALKPALSVREQLTFWRSFNGAPTRTVMDALSVVGLTGLADLPAGVLSAGQRRRVALARLLVSHRPIWLLDEPTSALDVHAQEALFGIIDAHLADNGLLLVATHHDLPFEHRTLRLGTPS